MRFRKANDPGLAKRRARVQQELDEETHCKQCGDKIEPTKARHPSVFKGRGRPRQFCSAMCRQQSCRADRRARNSSSVTTFKLAR